MVSRDVLNRALELGLLLGLPAAVGLAMLAQPIVTVLFERGAFSPAASLATAQVLAALALGLPAQVLAKVVAPGFFAFEDTATPVRVAVLALAGLAWLLWRRGRLWPDSMLLRRGLGIAVAALVMTAVLRAADGISSEPGVVALTVAIASACAAFALAAWLAGAIDIARWRRASGA